jgi:uncharacterized membrane protein
VSQRLVRHEPAARLPPAERLVRHERHLALALAVAWTALYATLAVLRHLTWHSTAYDLTVFDQAYWNTTQGRVFESTLDRGSCEPTSFLGGHLSLVHFALFPLYALVPRADTLVVLQAIAIGLGAWPVYVLARDRLRPGAERLVWVAAYLLTAPLSWMALFDFHEIPFAIPFLGWALVFVARGRHWWAVLILIASFLVKEELPLVALGFAALLLLKRSWLPGAALGAASVAWFVLAVKVVIPAFAGADYRYTAFYAGLGADEVEIVRTVLTDPGRTLGVLAEDGRMKLRYVGAIFGSGLGLAALSGPYAVLALPTLAYSLLSDYSHQYSLQTHYPATLVPLAVGAGVLGMTRLPVRLRALASGGVLVASLALAYLYGDVPLGPKFDPSRFRAEPRYSAIAPALAAIPPGARVSAADFVAAQLGHRRFIREYSAQHTCGDADYVILDVADPQTFLRDRAAFDREREALRGIGYDEIATGDGLAVLRRR